jgi:Rrf2 family iron-sulfur cluster assembly transcriptional regulator
MRLSTKGRYSVMAMVDIAKHGGGNPITLAEIAERQAISLSYLEQLFAKLRLGGLVKSVRGPGGGYLLAHGADGTRIADIILAVDEPIDATQCGGKENCLDDRRCMTHELWASLNTHIFSFLHSVSLEQLVRQQDKPEVNVLQDHRASAGKKSEPVPVV